MDADCTSNALTDESMMSKEAADLEDLQSAESFGPFIAKAGLATRFSDTRLASKARDS